ncbi:hypothetical protein MTBBW1_80149 [Desulfamplus magnetovallimortis]|uniref:FAD dependent oxidoreductase n=1 Tax=Desulfamplus magnetovallimortis TaxID=1246637 RepID=L0R5F7_9BACT|nr:FAD-dependent oxidoreductase [Desulfamplus magnetovallimortis]CCO06755.1 hypothetical protein DEMABW1_80149 [Desulfamplus magnetovallimortis BW-1]SLM32806.1 hypothetical protein MTBBW1_80149 [Desulfamplus magnetovallimortis]
MDGHQKYDVVVVGAGVSGMSAAITAAKLGLKTAIVEKKDVIGGVARDCFHTHMGGFFLNDPSSPFSLANHGICKDIHDALVGQYSKKVLVKRGKVELLAFEPSWLWGFLTDRIEEGRVSLHLLSKCESVIVEKGNIVSLKLFYSHDSSHEKEEIIILKADAFIDTTGNADLSFLCSPDAVFTPDRVQLGGYCFLLEGGFLKEFFLKIPYTARSIINELGWKKYLAFVTISLNELNKTWVVKFSLVDETEIPKCQYIFDQLMKRLNIEKTIRVLDRSEVFNPRVGLLSAGVGTVNYVSGNSTSKDGIETDVSCVPPQKGNLTLEFVKGTWPGEFWNPETGTQYEYHSPGRYYCVPKETLTSAFAENLFFGGRCISASVSAQSSIRVMGTCMATGELAAHCAAQYINSKSTPY